MIQDAKDALGEYVAIAVISSQKTVLASSPNSLVSLPVSMLLLGTPMGKTFCDPCFLLIEKNLSNVCLLPSDNFISEMSGSGEGTASNGLK